MERHKDLARVLALDLHPRSFGYVVVEGPTRLLDWGVCSHRQKGVVSDALVRKTLRLLIDLWRPAALVLKNPPRVMQKPNHRRKGILERPLPESFPPDAHRNFPPDYRSAQTHSARKSSFPTDHLPENR